MAYAGSVATLVAMCLSATAGAAPTTIPVTSTGIKVLAAPGTRNVVSIDYRVFDQGTDGYHVDAQYITDTAGLTVIDGNRQICTQPSANTTACVDTGTTAGVPDGSTGTGEDPTFLLGDLNDTFRSNSVGNLAVRGGPGNDRMAGSSRPIIDILTPGEAPTTQESDESFYGQAGNDILKGFGQGDLLVGGSGDDRIDGGKGEDNLDGGAGDDVINARDGARDARIDCGPGDDRAIVDKVDPKPVSC